MQEFLLTLLVILGAVWAVAIAVIGVLSMAQIIAFFWEDFFNGDDGYD